MSERSHVKVNIDRFSPDFFLAFSELNFENCNEVQLCLRVKGLVFGLRCELIKNFAIFSAPELVDLDDPYLVSGPADMWSIGVLLYAL